MSIGAPGKRLLLLAALLIVVGATAAIGQWQAGPGASTPAEQRAEPGQVGGLVRGEAEEAEEYAADPGKMSGESAALHSIEDYWLTRISYPTGNFDTRWVVQAAEQDRN